MEKQICPFNRPVMGTRDIIVCDVTLREGETAPGAYFTQEEKVELAKRLDKAGVSQLQLCLMNESEEMKKSAMELCSLGLSAKTELMSSGMSPKRLYLIDFLMECNPDIVHSSFSVSPYLSKNWGAVEKEQIKEYITSVTGQIHKYGKTANISFMDATRANPEDLLELVSWAAQAGAERIRLADTTGAISPEGIYEMVSGCVEQAERYGAMVGVHCHNDFGLALANTLSAVKAGARLVDVSVNGLGDRSGNTPLAELAAALEALYGSKTGLDLAGMMELSRFAADASGCGIPVTKPLVGKYAFSHELNQHIGAQLENPQAFQCIRAEAVGNKTEIIFGKFSGENSIEWKIRESGRKIDRRLYPEILRILAEEAGKNKGYAAGDEEFWAAVKLAEMRSLKH